jgi:hypothetical protein
MLHLRELLATGKSILNTVSLLLYIFDVHVDLAR